MIKFTGTTLAQSYADFLPIWEPIEAQNGPTGAPGLAPDGNDGQGEPPCFLTENTCDDETCTSDCLTTYGQAGGCMVVPDMNMCCCGM